MNALARKWIDALRSGQYKQGQKKLRDGDAFCCLGVLCDISGLDKWEYCPNAASYMGFDSIPNRKVLEAAGVRADRIDDRDNTSQFGRSCSISLKGLPYRYKTIHELNDLGEVTFDDIADLLEKHQDEIFEP